MVYRADPTYLWPKPSGLFFFKLGIPPELRQHYPSSTPGKFKTHIVESLGTHSRAEANRLKVPRLHHHLAEFRRLKGLAKMPGPKPGQALMSQVREALRELEAEWKADRITDADYQTLRLVQSDQAEAAHRRIERDEGPQAAELARQKMIRPEVLTIGEALPPFLATKDVSEQYKEAYQLAVSDLMGFLGAEDAFARDITPGRALEFVDWLNAEGLSASAKKKRLSNLNMLWKYMHRRGWPASPWEGHTITDNGTRKRRAAAQDAGEDDPDAREDVRAFTEAEAVRVLTLAAPQDKRRRTYTRSLFRELYALGFTTGMRLNEIASLRAADVQPWKDGWLSVTLRRESVKNDDSARTVPVGHPVAVKLLQRRLEAQDNPKGRLFPECAPGGPDKKPSWHVSKAMSRERIDPKRLGLGGEVNFHSTRHNFATLLENSEGDDTIGQQRYMGHSIPTMLHKRYSGGAGLKKLCGVVEGLRHAEALEAALRLALGESDETAKD